MIDAISVNAIITACMCFKPSPVPSMFVMGEFTTLVGNGEENHEGRQALERVMISRWRDLRGEVGNKRVIFITRNLDNSGIVKIMFAYVGFSVSLLSSDELDTGAETMALRCPQRATIEVISKAIALINGAVGGKAKDEALEAVRGKLEAIKNLGFVIERC